MVAITYIPNPENKRCVNHIDGNKRNNHYVNLEWATYQENERHSFKSLGKQIQHSDTTKEKMRAKAKGRDMTKAVSAAAAAKKGKPAINRCRVILNNSIIYNSITEASEDKRVSITAIMNNLSGLSKKTKVGVWQYE